MKVPSEWQLFLSFPGHSFFLYEMQNRSFGSFNSPKILFPSFQLIIALEETIDVISIYAPSQTQKRGEM